MASTLFSRVSNGTGFPELSMSFHSPVTPMIATLNTYFGENNFSRVGLVDIFKLDSSQTT
jgi:hypothetical protein